MGLIKMSSSEPGFEIGGLLEIGEQFVIGRSSGQGEEELEQHTPDRTSPGRQVAQSKGCHESV